MNWLRCASVARLPEGFAPPEYLPESTPCPSGEKTICESPSRSQAGITSASIFRRSSEYCGWFETGR